MIIAVMEWNVDKGISPVVFAAPTEAVARRAVADYLRPYLPGRGAESEINGVDGHWLTDHPYPDLDDETAVADWLQALHLQTTDAYLTIYHPTSDPAFHTEETYLLVGWDLPVT